MSSTNQAKYIKPKQPKHQVFHGFKFNRRLQESLFIFTFAVSIFLLLSFVTYNPSDPSWSCTGASDKVSNAAGYVGAWLADIFLCAFGYIAYLFPVLISCAAWMSWRQRFSDAEGKTLFLWRTLGFFLILLSGSSLIDLHFKSAVLPFGAGGILGNLLHFGMVGILNVWGANLFLVALFFCGVTFFSGLSWLKLFSFVGLGLLFLASLVGKCALCLRLPRFKADKAIDDIFEAKVTTKTVGGSGNDFITTPFVKSSVVTPIAAGAVVSSASAASKNPPPLISVATQIKPSIRAEKERQLKILDFEKSTLPPLSLLDPPDRKAGNSYTQKQLEEMSRAVELRMKDFGIDAQVVAVHPGPVVTRFELQLAAGTKVSRITTLAKDLARSLSVISVRVVEVIPGKSVIGLELPNATREVVRLREILSSQQYEHTKSSLALALGKDISGNPIIVDLAKMPHLLVAGTTGSGKSVCLNAILLSLIYKYTPRELRLILIDPKMLELSVYDNIAHLLTPVVTNMKEAANALRWCVAEMERRYRLMMHLGVRNIAGFNGKVVDARNKGKPLLDPLWREESGEEQQELQELPYIVVIADEYADMIMVVGKKVEELIARIAQKARAAGIHLLLATQRPSVDVITGLIKANIPARIAFQVSSKIDSRTILDQSGAEQLLGYGDMLYLPPGAGIPVRVHGAFVADDEVHKVAEEVKSYEKPQYLDEITEGSGSGDFTWDGEGSDGSDNGGGASDAEQDPLYDQAVKLVTETRRASVSSIQRRFKIGYNRAARIVEAMEVAGVVGAMESNGNREVLAPSPLKD